MENIYDKIMEGDEKALKELLEVYGKHLIFFINGYVKNISVAEELMEDSFCDLILSKKKFKNKSSFKTYLFAIGKNKAFDYLKKEKRRGEFPDENTQDTYSDMQDLEQTVINNDEKRRLHNAMDTLKADYKQVLVLIYFEEMSYKEAGKVMGKRELQIKNLAYRARQSLKTKLIKENIQ